MTSAIPPSPAEEAVELAQQILSMRVDVDIANAKVQRVEALHPASTIYAGRVVCAGCSDPGGDLIDYPCPTVAALASPAPAPQGGAR